MTYLSPQLVWLLILSHLRVQFSSVQFNLVAQSCPTLCDPMNRSTPGLPVHHQLPEFTQTHVHQVGDAIQPSHPLSSPSPPAPNPSQHQSLFQWVNPLHEVAKVLEFQLHSLQRNPRADLLSVRFQHMNWDGHKYWDYSNSFDSGMCGLISFTSSENFFAKIFSNMIFLSHFLISLWNFDKIHTWCILYPHLL